MLDTRFLLAGVSALAGILTVSMDADAYELAGGAQSGTLYRLGEAMAEVATRRTRFQESQPVTLLPSDGFAESASLLRDGQVEFAIIDSITASALLTGTGPFADQGEFKDFSIVGILWYDVDHFVIRRSAVDSGTIADFDAPLAESLSLSNTLTPEANSNAMVLETMGLDFSKDTDSDAPSSTDFETLGGIALSAPMSDSQVQTIIEGLPGGGVLLSLTSGQFAAATEGRRGAWESYRIPAGTYPGQETDIDTTARAVMLVTRNEVREGDIYQLAQSLFGNLSDLREQSALASRIDLAGALSADMIFPLHPGASRYFEDVGLMSDGEELARRQSSQDPLARRDSTIDPWKAYRPLQSIVFSGAQEDGRTRSFVSFFEFNSVGLDEPGEATVAEVATYGESLGGAEIYIAGHADRVGSPEVNRKIAIQRAKTVAERLAELGYDRDLITYEGFGETKPAVSTDDEEKHPQNRRIEIMVMAPPAGAVDGALPKPAIETPAVAEIEEPEPVEAPDVTEVSEIEDGAEAVNGEAESTTGDLITAARDSGTEATGTRAEPATTSGADDDLPAILLESASVDEDNPDFSLQLRLSKPSDRPLVLVLTTMSDTATAGEDFENLASVVTLRPGETSTNLVAPVIDDAVAEGDESFILRVSGDPSAVQIPNGQLTVTIRDND